MTQTKKTKNNTKPKGAPGKRAPAVKPSAPPPKQTTTKRKEVKPKKTDENTLERIYRGQTPKPLDGFASTTAVDECVIKYTRYFDSTAASFGMFCMDLIGSPFFQQGAASKELLPGRVLKVRMYALPLFNVDTSDATLVVATSVPGLVGASTTGYVTLNQRTTLLTPRADSKWVFVGGWDDSKIYGEGDYRPAATADSAATGYNQNLMSWAVLGSDTLELSSHLVQMKIDFSVAWPMPLVTHLRHAVLPSTTPTWAANSTSDLPLDAVLASISGVVNRS